MNIVHNPLSEIKPREFEHFRVCLSPAVDFPESRVLESLEVVIVLVLRRADKKHAAILFRFDISIDARHEKEPVGITFLVRASIEISNPDNAVDV